MEFNINGFDLLMVAAGVMTYAIGAALWTCLEVPVLLWRTPAMNQASNHPYNLENRNEFL